jgi:hypothetical protein
MVPAGDKTRGHMSPTQAVLWKGHVAELLGQNNIGGPLWMSL